MFCEPLHSQFDTCCVLYVHKMIKGSKLAWTFIHHVIYSPKKIITKLFMLWFWHCILTIRSLITVLHILTGTDFDILSTNHTLLWFNVLRASAYKWCKCLKHSPLLFCAVSYFFAQWLKHLFCLRNIFVFKLSWIALFAFQPLLLFGVFFGFSVFFKTLIRLIALLDILQWVHAKKSIVWRQPFKFQQDVSYILYIYLSNWLWVGQIVYVNPAHTN